MLNCNPVINYSPDSNPVGNIKYKPINAEIVYPTPQLFSPHRGKFNKLFWIKKGSGALNIDFQKHPLHDNQLFLISEEPVYFFEEGSKVTGGLILFKNEIIPQIDLFLNVQIALSYEKLKDLRPVIDRLLFLMEYETNHLDKKNYLSPLPYYLTALIQIIITEHKKSCKPIGHTTGLYVKFLEKVVLKGNQLRKVEEYAKMLGISEESLLKDVKSFSGKSPKKIIDHYVLLEAKRRLAFDTVDIKEISKDLGFLYSSHFNMFFKSRAGVTPRNFRTKHSCIYIVED